MQVRSLHFSDFLKLGRMHQAAIGLNLPYALVVPDLPLPAALTQHLPVNSFNSSVYICEMHGKPQAFVQARARQRRDEWEVLSLGVVGKVQPEPIEVLRSETEDGTTLPEQLSDEAALQSQDGFDAEEASVILSSENEGEVEEVIETISAADSDSDETSNDYDYTHSWPEEIELAWYKTLEHLVVDAGEKGVVRVYARLSTESPQLSLFSQIGFHAYTHETLFQFEYSQPIERPVSADLKLKEQRNRDAWYIQQLYAAITPSFVQNSEQNTSRSWEIHKAYLPRPTRETGWLLLEADKAVAYIRVLTYRNKHLLRIMNLDTRRELLPDLIRYALSTLKAGADTQVYCVVREYQMEQEAVLEDIGFSRSFGKQAVLVKHTVQYVRSTERQLARRRDSKLELARYALPRRMLVRCVRFVQRKFNSLVML